jgi:hypothetical protein
MTNDKSHHSKQSTNATISAQFEVAVFWLVPACWSVSRIRRVCWHLLPSGGHTCFSNLSQVLRITFRCHSFVAHSAYPSFRPLNTDFYLDDRPYLSVTRLIVDHGIQVFEFEFTTYLHLSTTVQFQTCNTWLLTTTPRITHSTPRNHLYQNRECHISDHDSLRQIQISVTVMTAFFDTWYSKDSYTGYRPLDGRPASIFAKKWTQRMQPKIWLFVRRLIQESIFVI